MAINCGLSDYDYLSLPEPNSCEVLRHASSYNSLTTVEEADSMLQARGDFFNFLEDASQLAHSHLNDFAAMMGLRLLHRHFDLEPGLVMVENNFNRSLVTSAQNISVSQYKNAVPYGWIFSDSGNLEVFEFSTDPLVQSTVEIIRNSSFLPEMGNLIVSNQMQNLFALSILNRNSLEHREG